MYIYLFLFVIKCILQLYYWFVIHLQLFSPSLLPIRKTGIVITVILIVFYPVLQKANF